jgi:hypothetical protein
MRVEPAAPDANEVRVMTPMLFAAALCSRPKASAHADRRRPLINEAGLTAQVQNSLSAMERFAHRSIQKRGETEDER